MILSSLYVDCNNNPEKKESKERRTTSKTFWCPRISTTTTKRVDNGSLRRTTYEMFGWGMIYFVYLSDCQTFISNVYNFCVGIP